MEWKVTWWGDDGVEHTSTGTDIVHARNLEGAHEAMYEAVRRSSAVEAMLLECEVRSSPRERWRGPKALRSGPIASWDLCDALQQAIREKAPPSAAFRDLRERTSMTPLALMVSTASAFGLGLRDLSAVAPWAKGDLADERLDGDLLPKIEAHEVTWNARHAMRERLERGERLAPILRDLRERRGHDSPSWMAFQVAEVLDLPTGVCAAAVSGWWRGVTSDDELEATMAPGVEKARRQWSTSKR